MYGRTKRVKPLLLKSLALDTYQDVTACALQDLQNHRAPVDKCDHIYSLTREYS